MRTPAATILTRTDGFVSLSRWLSKKGCGSAMPADLR